MTRVTFNSQSLDVLREVGNIGAGHAATALSTMLQESVRISVTSARLCRFDDIPDIVGGPEELITGIFVRTYDDLDGTVMLLLSLDSARKLVQRLLAITHEIDDFTELEVSALAEVGNILGGSYMNAISQLTGMRIQQSVPAVAVDMAGAILDVGILAAGEVSDSAIVIDTLITQGDSDVDGHFFLLPDPDAMRVLFARLGCSDA